MSRETAIKNQLSKHFNVTGGTLAFYANMVKKPSHLGVKIPLALIRRSYAGKLTREVLEYYLLGISEDGVFFGKYNLSKLPGGEILTWKQIDYVEITEGFMVNRIIFTLADSRKLNFKILKTQIGLKHGEKTKKLKTFLYSINKLKGNIMVN